MKTLSWYLFLWSLGMISFSNFVKAEPDNIDVTLFKRIPLLVEKLREQEIRNVGVLPFRFQDNAGISHSNGALIQANLAARTEQVIAYIRDVDDPVNVVFGMLAQARSVDANAAYDTEASRAKLLTLSYKFPVAEMQPSKLDGFVTGVIEVSQDWKQSTLTFEYFDAKNGQTGIVGPFLFPTDRKMLMQYGRAYSLSASGWDARAKGVQTRNIFDLIRQDEQEIESQEKQVVAAVYDKRIGESVEGDPWTKFPVTLTIQYDGQPQTLTKDRYLSRFNFSLADPKPNQRVTFELKNNLTEKIAVVLAVNGQNLIYLENANDPDSCNKFILEPSAKYSVPGIYLQGLKSYQPLVGADNQKTTELARRLPAETLGVISLSVFREVPTYDPGGISHRVAQGGGEKVSSTASDAVAKVPESSKNPSNKTAPLEFLTQDASETWYDRATAGMLGSGSSQSVSKGSFHPTASSSSADTWSDLSKGIGRNAVAVNTSRGLIVPGTKSTEQNISTAKMGPVSQTDVAVIRYLSVSRP